MNFKKIILVFTLLFSLQAYGQVVNSIVITGNERVEDETIKSYLNITPGVHFDSDQLDASIKKIYSSNLFQKVNVTLKGSTLYVKVVENPKINLVAFEGNSKVKTKDLESEVSLRPRGIYTKAKVQEDVNRIIDLYNKNGRFSVKVTPQIIVLPQNRVDLVYKINEGPTALIGKINFVGNNAFHDDTLRAELSSKQTRWYLFLSSSDSFNPNRVEYDRELLTRFYQSRGYANFKIISVITNVSEKKERFYITYTIDEGEKFNFGQIDLKLELKSSTINVADLKDAITTKTGSVYDVRKIEKSIDQMTTKINDQGFAFVDIIPEVTLNEEKKLVNINYHIGESKRIYINKINIKGNVRTSDKVIRREFLLAEGDPYNATKIQRSEKRINDLDFFEPTSIETTRTDQSDKVDLDLKVQEKSTSNLSFAGGFSTADGPIGKVGFSETNLLGKGQELELGYAQSKDKIDANLSFTEPYMLDRPIAGGFDLFTSNVASNKSQYRFYSESKTGFRLRTGYEITENLRHTIFYGFTAGKVYNVASNADVFTSSQSGRHNTSIIGHALSYDRRNSKQNPSEGYLLVLGQDYAGLGGNTDFFRQTASGKYYYPIYNEDVVLSIGADAGYVKGLKGKHVDIMNRFYLGGAGSVRGFEPSGIGPRDKTTGESVGGTLYYSGNTEVKFPLGFGKEMGVFGAAFVDAGSIVNPDVSVAQKANLWNSNSIRSAYGVGIGFSTPMGPIRVNYALPMSKTKFDQTKSFDIEFKTNF